ncbi:ABC transporter permease [Vreelandella jeotgali]|uniref:ABC transporter permease n=1 Tax=Vreelandella jeotgali TaxID=553386 RepID=UPI000345730D|nr:FtsX-like permease family protein [Halomonas jeotgali]
MTPALRLALTSLKRDLRAPDVRALFVALVLAVAAATMIAFFLDRLEGGLERQAGQLLGGDLVLEQPEPFDDSLVERLQDAGLAVSRQVEMSSMLQRDERFQLASLKAVDSSWPLYGSSRVAGGDTTQSLERPPEAGRVWADPRLKSLLGLGIGDTLRVGEAELQVSGFIQREANPSGGFGSFNPRLMLNAADLAATGLVQPGSRIDYSLLGAGAPEALDSLAPLLDRLRENGVQVRDVRNDRPRLGSALNRAESYLGIAGLAAVLLAGVAVAMASRRYVERHLDTAALLRCFGASQRQLTLIFAGQLAGLALVASLLGALAGLVGQALLVWLLADFLPLTLPAPGPAPLFLGVLTALAVLVGFAGPALLRIKRVSALKVLRRELDPLPPSAWLVTAAAATVFGGLLWLYSASFSLAVTLLLGGMLALGVLWVCARLLLSGVLALAGRLSGRSEMSRALRLGGRQLARRRQAGLGQLLAFAITFFAMAMMVLVRGDLLSTWQARLPDNTPNYFAINIQPGEREAFADAIDSDVESQSALYPMVRGRINRINGQPPQETLPPDARGDDALRRTLNLTWRAEVPDGNRVVAGEWFADAAADHSASADNAPGGWLEAVDTGPARTPVPISLQDGLAERLHLTLGDTLTFRIGSESLTARITSLRSLDWDSFTPNFYVIFPPGILNDFAHSYITAFYLPEGNPALVNRLIERFPGVSLLNVDALLGQVRDVLSQVTRAVELILVLVLLAGVSVLYAALTASQPARAHESGLLRVFGAGNRLISRMQGAEFALLGGASGLLGAALAELATALLSGYWLDLPVRFHGWVWLVLPPGGALLIGAIGHALSRGLRRQAPAASLTLVEEV